MKISIIIPAYNVEDHLQKAVDSIFVTGYPDIEIIIVDDNSTDNTHDIARKIEHNHNDIVKVLKIPGSMNQGASAARNKGIECATGELVSFLDADDWYLENRFSTCVDILKNNPDVDGVYEKTLCIYKDKVESIKMLNKKELFLDGTHLESVTNRLLKSSWTTNAITLKRSILKKSGLFNETLLLGQDIELWLRLSCIAKLVEGNSAAPVAVYNRHGSNRYNPLIMGSHLIIAYRSFLDWLDSQTQCNKDRKDIEAHLEFLSGPSKKIKLPGCQENL